MMNYQGHLFDPANGSDYYDGMYDIECRIYRQETGGTAIWGGVYTVYVKDGYFNIMLGDSSATNLGYTYPNTELWRALWDDEDASVRNDLWLGITMRQDYRHNNIAAGSRSEISPRQRLLAGPYAFRAQAAQYAKESKGGFKVGGDITFGSTPWSIGSRLKYNGSMLYLGLTDGSTPNQYSTGVSVSGSKFTVNSANAVEMKSIAGDVTLEVASGHNVKVKNGWLKVDNAHTVMNSGNTSLEMVGSTITGIGNLNWAKTSSDTAVAPFVIKNVDMTITTNTSSAYVDLETASLSNYKYIVAGVDLTKYQPEDRYGVKQCYVFTAKDNGKYRACIDFSNKPSIETNVRVILLGIHKGLVSVE